MHADHKHHFPFQPLRLVSRAHIHPLATIHHPSLLLLVLLGVTTLESNTVTLALELDRGDKTLDLRGLGVLLAALGGDRPADNELADILLRGEVEELADLGGALWSETDWLGLVGEA